MIPNGSPYFQGRHAERERMVATRAEDAHCPIVYVNQVGGQDELIFDGASFVVDDDGDLLARAPQMRERVEVVDLDMRPVFRTRLLDPRGRDTAPALPVVAVSDAGGRPPGDRPARRRSRRCSTRSRRSTTRSCSPPTTTSPRTASPTSCSGCPAAIDSSLVAVIAADALGPGARPRRVDAEPLLVGRLAHRRRSALRGRRHRAAHDRHRAGLRRLPRHARPELRRTRRGPHRGEPPAPHPRASC